MLTYQRKPISLSLISTDLPIWSIVKTSATLYHNYALPISAEIPTMIVF